MSAGYAVRVISAEITQRQSLKPKVLLLMDKILHDPKDPKLWELWYIPYNG